VLRQVVDLSGRRDALVPNQAVRGCSSQELYGESYTPCSMARKKGYAPKMKKIEPAVQTMTFVVDADPTTGVAQRFLDLSQCASLVNRRFYRQGINWAVSSIKVLSTEFTGTVTIAKLPETWVMSNAWEKGFRTWQRMNNDALEEAESVRPRFLDFKIFANAAHHSLGFDANLLPISIAGTATPGEWQPSKYVVPNAPGGLVNNFEVIAAGASYPGGGFTGLNAVSLIEGYAASRALPNVVDPNVPGDTGDASGPTPENWMAALFNEGTNQDDRVLDDMRTENNLAPYPFENDGTQIDTMYPGGANQLSDLQIHDREFATTTTIGGTTRLKGGMFPCGLLNFEFVTEDGPLPEIILQIDLVPGNHRGYLCEPMTDM